MDETPSADASSGAEQAWHRRQAVALFNATWDLIDKCDRTEDDDAEMLLSAASSRWHWGQVGGAEQIASSDWQLAHVASLLGAADVATRFARRNLVLAESEGWDGWRLASAHEGMARACAVSGDAEGRSAHLGAARAALGREPDADDREVIEGQIATVPRVEAS
jgi:hypothetical protein